MVRPVVASDWRALRDLRLRALADAPDAFGQTLEQARTADDHGWKVRAAPRPGIGRFVAERDGALVGMIAVVVEPRDLRAANIYAMWVAPAARRQGLARALVREALAWARRRAALDVRLEVSDRAPGAEALYRVCGFHDTGHRSPLRPDSDVVSKTFAIRLPVLVMGVVNVTPDSFSDGGDYLAPAAAIAHGHELVAHGADILDIGGEATNPRATAVTAAEELRRVLPVISRLAETGVAISVDTTKAEVAREAVAAGATIVNDVSGGLFDPDMPATLAALGEVTYIAGHLRGRSIAEVFAAENPVGWTAIADELGARIAALATPSRTQVWADPGIGFGKGADPEGNVALIRHAGDLAQELRCPVVIGASRKRFLRRLLGAVGGAPDLDLRSLDAASVLASLAAVRAGAHVVRVHNVALLHLASTAYNKD